MAISNNNTRSEAADDAQRHDKFSAELEKIRGDLAALKKDLSALTNAGAEEARMRLKEGVDEAEAQTRELMDTATSEFEDLRRQAERAVRKNPTTAVGAALAIGYFLAKLRR